METRREREPSLGRGGGASWAVTSPPPSLSRSALLSGMPVLYHQSSISSLLFVANPEQPSRDESSTEGPCRKGYLSIPTQLLMPDGGVALGMPPGSLLTGSGSAAGGGAGRNGGADSEESRMSALRMGELAVILSDSPESQVRSRRSRLLLLLAILLSLQYISLFAILQGNDTPPIFSRRKGFGGQRNWYDVGDDEQVALVGPRHSYITLRHKFYVMTLSLCLVLPVLVFSAMVERKRQMEAAQSRNAQGGTGSGRTMFPSPNPSVALSVAVIAFTYMTLMHGIFILWTYFDIMVFLLLFAIRYTLNRLNLTCFSSHLMLTKAANSI